MQENSVPTPLVFPSALAWHKITVCGITEKQTTERGSVARAALRRTVVAVTGRILPLCGVHPAYAKGATQMPLISTDSGTSRRKQQRKYDFMQQ